MALERGQRGLGRIAGAERLVLDRGRMRGEGRRDLVGARARPRLRPAPASAVRHCPAHGAASACRPPGAGLSAATISCACRRRPPGRPRRWVISCAVGCHGAGRPARCAKEYCMHPNADNLIASRFDTVIYDLDGTLIDSAKDMQVAVSNVLADHGLPAVSEDDVRIFMGQGSKVTMAKAFAKYGKALDDDDAERRDPRVRALLRGRSDQQHQRLPGRRRRGRPLRPPGPEAGGLHQQVRAAVAHDPGAPQADAADRRPRRRRHLSGPQARPAPHPDAGRAHGQHARPCRHDRQFDPRRAKPPMAPACPRCW